MRQGPYRQVALGNAIVGCAPEESSHAEPEPPLHAGQVAHSGKEACLNWM
jgi:hypothetical protein